MRYYESLYIVNPNYEQDRLDEEMKMVTNKLGEYGFSIINHRVWGKKRLAYSIQKHKYGTFVLLHFETEFVENLDRFERFMVLQKPILRNQTVVLDERPEVQEDEEPVLDETVKEDEVTKTDGETSEEAVAEPTPEESSPEEATVEEAPVEEESAGEEEVSEAPEEVVKAEETEKIEETEEVEKTEEVQE